ncbi:MAG: DUF2306 domain-containing protein [Pseudomonadales bacterium]|nr:DUF2306 domain-containing protein [Pseudomonadales bacterium]
MDRAETSLAVVVSFLALAGIAGSIFFLISGGANSQFETYPVITRLHVIPGMVYLALAPLQFSKTIRSKSAGYHRWVGRLLAGIAMISGAGALFLGIIIPYSGLPEQIIIGIFGTFFLVATIRGFVSARSKNFQAHREWMMRAFAIGLSIATMRLIFVPILIGLGEPSVEQAQLYSIISFSIAFALHSGFAEYWIIRTRPKTSRQDATLVAT